MSIDEATWEAVEDEWTCPTVTDVNGNISFQGEKQI